MCCNAVFVASEKYYYISLCFYSLSLLSYASFTELLSLQMIYPFIQDEDPESFKRIGDQAAKHSV